MIDLFKNIQSSIYKIKTTIKSDSDLRKLLYFETYDPKNGSEVPFNTIDEYIYLNPVFDNNLEPYNKSCFITISLVDLDVDEELNYSQGTIRLDVICKNSLWEIKNDEIRPIAIVSIINRLLNNTKFDVSHKLNYQGIQLVTLNKNSSGYIIMFDIIEGGGLENEF